MAEAATEQLPCTRCGKFIPSRREVFYSDRGDVLCHDCHELLDMQATTERYVKSVRSAGYTGPLMVLAGLVSSMFLGFFGLIFMGIGVLVSGGALWGLARDAELRSKLGVHLVFILIFSGLGVLGGGGCLGLMVLGVGAAFLR